MKIARRVADLLGMIKFSHTLFALPFALMGAVLAAHRDGGWSGRAQDWLGILLCMVFARSAGMAFNRLVDRQMDANNPRTAGRHLPAGQLSVGSVALFTLISSIGFIASTTLFLPNRLPVILSVPVLIWLLSYSYAKRFTSLVHFWLGLALMLAPISAWIALRGGMDWPPIWLGFGVFFWVAGFDIIYACQDADFDRHSGVHSIPGRFGVKNALRLAAACHAVMVIALLLLGLSYPMGTIYFIGIAVVALLLVYEHLLVRPDDLTRVNIAFFQVNIAISTGLLALTVVDLIW